MQASEFRSLRAKLSDSDEELAESLGEPVQRLRSWLNGAATVPRRPARVLSWLVAVKERQVALAASGIDECAWINRWDSVEAPTDIDEMTKHHEAAAAHILGCATCQARERYVKERLPDLPPFPTGWLGLAVAWMPHVPAPLHAPIFGALFLGAIVLLRAVVVIPMMIAQPSKALSLLGTLVVTVAAASAAGAAGGAGYAIARHLLRPFGKVGEYLTGMVAVGGYLLALAVAAPRVFGESFITFPDDWVIFSLMTVIFGAVLAHSMFKKTP